MITNWGSTDRCVAFKSDADDDFCDRPAAPCAGCMMALCSEHDHEVGEEICLDFMNSLGDDDAPAEWRNVLQEQFYDLGSRIDYMVRVARDPTALSFCLVMPMNHASVGLYQAAFAATIHGAPISGAGEAPTAQRVACVPDDPSACPRCRRPRATSKTPINAHGVCWRQPTMRSDNMSAMECEHTSSLISGAADSLGLGEPKGLAPKAPPAWCDCTDPKCILGHDPDSSQKGEP